jgi:SAM-dependent methyltransferase
MEAFGTGLRPGDAHYRAYVGPPEDYDLIGGLQFTLLFVAGLRETHTLLDVGCGSLRAGRLLIPYLRPGHYVGVEPNAWLVEEGIARELGAAIVQTKRPRFLTTADFDFGDAGTEFDFVLAQSILSHTYPDLARRLFAGAAEVLRPDGALLATYVDGAGGATGSGWLYPGCVEYVLPEITGMAAEADLRVAPLDWPHPRQRWFAAAGTDQVARAISDRVRWPSGEGL